MVQLYRCPMRWGDMDALGHVNNVRYLDYLQEARIHFFATGPKELNEGAVITGHQVEYLKPAEFTGGSVEVRLQVCAVGRSRIELFAAIAAEGTPVCRAYTQLCAFDRASERARPLSEAEQDFLAAQVASVEPAKPLRTVEIGRQNAHEYELWVRYSDQNGYGHVDNAAYFDYLQEARVAMLAQADPDLSQWHWVVARQDVEYRRQMFFRPESYLVRTAVQCLGTSSLTLAYELGEAGTETVYATGRTVLVNLGDDNKAQPIAETVRERLGRWVLDNRS